MKKRTSKLSLLSLLLIVPSLMAATSRRNESYVYYNDFSVSVKTLEQNVYELTINNYGDAYIPKDKFTRYDDNNAVTYYQYVSESEYDNRYTQLIKPKEICTIKIQAQNNNDYLPLEDGNVYGFETHAYIPNETYRFATDPYNVSFSEHDNYNSLDIDCTINVVAIPNTSESHVYWHYNAVTWKYEGKEYCSISEPTDKIDGAITILFESGTIINPNNIIINKIDSFLSVEKIAGTMPSKCCGSFGSSKTLKIIGLVLMCIGITIGFSALLFFTFKAIAKKVTKKEKY